MGSDAHIYFAASPDYKRPFWLPDEATPILCDGDGPEGATHEMDQSWRYYGPTYCRGQWPRIATTLLYLFSDPLVTTVWYYGSYGPPEVFTPEDLHDLNAFWMENGNRPWTD